MKLNEKTKNFLNDLSIKQFGLTFDQLYHLVDENEKLKEENKKRKKVEKIKC